MWKWAPVSGQVGERLRHEGRDQPALLRQRLDHVAVEDRAVAGRQRVGEVEVLLELPVRVLVVGGVHVPAERVHVANDVGDEVERARQRADVVAGLLERVERVRDLDPAVLGLADQEVLELAADLELEARVRRALELVAEDRPRAVRPLLALHRRVAGEPADLGLPRQPREAADVGHRDQIGVVGRLADVARREAGEPGAVGEQPLELLGRDQLRARLRVHVHELREQELDPLVGDRAADVVGRRALRAAIPGGIPHMRGPGNGQPGQDSRGSYVVGSHSYPASTPTTKSISGSRICSISSASAVIPISRQRLR